MTSRSRVKTVRGAVVCPLDVLIAMSSEKKGGASVKKKKRRRRKTSREGGRCRTAAKTTLTSTTITGLGGQKDKHTVVKTDLRG